MKKRKEVLFMHLVSLLMLPLIGCQETPTPTGSPASSLQPTGAPAETALVNTDHITLQNAITYPKEKAVQWSTSFETEDGFIGTVTRSENTGKYVDTSLPDGDAVFLIDRAQVQATPVMTEYGSVGALFDQSTLTKYITHKRPSAKDPVSIMLPLKSPLAMNWYTITSANDVPERDPKDWTVYGSQDGETWEVVHEVRNYNFPVREETRLFRFENEAAYRFYKWEITRTGGQEHTQLAGLRIGRGSGEINVYSEEYTQNAQISPSLPREASEFFITLQKPQVVNRYGLISNTADPQKDPFDWTLYASADGENWVALHSENAAGFVSRNHEYLVDFSNTAAYQYYKLQVHKAALNKVPLLQGISLGYFDWQQGEPTAAIGSGAEITWGSVACKGWTGENALLFAGAHLGGGAAYAEVVLYDHLNVAIGPDTFFSYKVFPDFVTEYDYDYTSQFAALDLVFTDGTRLSELGAADQYGFGLTARAQGESKVYYTKAWNEVLSSLSEVAKGKTVQSVLAVYDKDANHNPGNTFFRTYFDDICIYSKQETVTALADYVNITRGTYPNTHVSSPTRGTCTPMVAVPHGFNQFTPVNDLYRLYTYHLEGNAKTMKHISLYHNPVAALGHYGEYSFMINSSLHAATANANAISYNNRGAEFSHENEISKAHYYSVVFDHGSAASDCRIEVTPTMHAAMLRFTFAPDSPQRNIIFDCPRGAGSLKFHEDGTFEGYSDMKQEGVYYGDSGARRMYFYGYTDVKPTLTKSFGKSGIASFEGVNTVNMKVASSFISSEQAKKNLEMEIGAEETFESVACRAKKAWEEILGKIRIEGAANDQLVTFYSCLYRTYLFPYAEHENVGTAENPKYAYANPYKGTQTKPEITEGTLYAGYGIWDTYRNTHQLYSVLTPEFAGTYAQGLVDHYTQFGWTPKYTVPKSVVCMNAGCDNTLSDLALKGVKFDYEAAYQALLKEVNCYNADGLGRQGSDSYPYTNYMTRNVSSNLECALGDYSLSRFAALLGKEEAEYFLNRSKAYLNSFVYENGEGWFLNGSKPNTNSWGEVFDPANWAQGYCESNAWHICAYATHDIEGMISLYGGKEAFLAKLEELFTAKNTVCYAYDPTWAYMLEARECKMGQHNHGNEPGHALPYLFNYAGAPYKTQQYVREILSRLYCGATMGGGYAGDEDSGELSAWYVLSALGFYPVELADNNYVIGSPLFPKVTVQLENGKTLTITAKGNDRDHIYIQSMKLNGKEWNKFYLNDADLVNGGEIEFVMGDTPSDWATGENAGPGTCVSQPGEMPTMYADLLVRGNKMTVENFDLPRKLTDDNNSTGSAKCTGETSSLAVALTEEKAVRFITITSGAGSAPTGFELLASDDGENWRSIEKRGDLVFEWDRYLRSFKVHDTAPHRHYKLVLTGPAGFEVAEVELIG